MLCPMKRSKDGAKIIVLKNLNEPDDFRIADRMREGYVWKSLPESIDLRFWNPPKLDRPDCKDQDVHDE